MAYKIFIGIPCYQMVPPEVLEDYMLFSFALGRRTKHDYFLGIKTKSEQYRARNAIVQAAAQVEADFLLMLDDDHKINVAGEPQSESYLFIEKLLEYMEKDSDLGVVGVLYFHRGGECRPVLLKEKDGAFIYLLDHEIKRKLQEVAVQGGGCMLIRMSVFERIGYEPFEPESKAGFGTDFQLCNKVRSAGFKVASDTSIEIGHWKATRSCVTSANRHEHMQEVQGGIEGALHNRLVNIYRNFRKDVVEYLNVHGIVELARYANQYSGHMKNFASYVEKGQLQNYYIDSGPSYLARACFIRSPERVHPFDSYILSLIRPEVPAIGVDVGCGAAPVTFEFLRAGHSMHFIDIHDSVPFKFLEWRASKYHLDNATFGWWPQDGSADYVLFLDSIEHFSDLSRQQHLKDAYRCLKPGGFLITNFMLNTDTENPEHIFMDKGAFMREVTQLGFIPMNQVLFQKSGGA